MAKGYVGGYAKAYGSYAQGGTPPPPNQAPSVTINGTATGTVGTQQSFQAIASDSDGQVTRVQLCLMANATTLTGYTVLDTDLVSPFVLNWTPSSAGNFNLRMRAVTLSILRKLLNRGSMEQAEAELQDWIGKPR